MRGAADVLHGVASEVVVIGAVALEAALSGYDARSAATTDVDGAVTITSAPTVIAHIERAGLKPSDEPHERGFTWVRGSLKIQLIRPPARVTGAAVSRLIPNTQFSVAENYREEVAFADRPEEPRLVVARPVAVLALKGHAFGRTRPTGERSSATITTRTYSSLMSVKRLPRSSSRRMMASYAGSSARPLRVLRQPQAGERCAIRSPASRVMYRRVKPSYASHVL